MGKKKRKFERASSTIRLKRYNKPLQLQRK